MSRRFSQFLRRYLRFGNNARLQNIPREDGGRASSLDPLVKRPDIGREPCTAIKRSQLVPSDVLLRNGSWASCDASNCRDCGSSFNARFRRGRLNFKPGLSLGRYATAVTGCRDIRGDDLILNEHTRGKPPSSNGGCGPRRPPTTDHEKSVNNDPESHTTTR